MIIYWHIFLELSWTWTIMKLFVENPKVSLQHYYSSNIIIFFVKIQFGFLFYFIYNWIDFHVIISLDKPQNSQSNRNQNQIKTFFWEYNSISLFIHVFSIYFVSCPI